MKATKRMLCLTLSMVLVFLLVCTPEIQAAGNENLPDGMYLTQLVSGTCTLCSAAMMIRSSMYINGNDNWPSVTENGIRATAWVNGVGLRWSFKYTTGGATVKVDHANVSGISSQSLKNLLDQHPEGIVLYCGKVPHAVFLTGYEGDTFYCADTVAGISGKIIPLDQSWLNTKYSTQASILKGVTAYWYVSQYQQTGNTVACGCLETLAGTYTCTTTTSGLLIRAGHGTIYSAVGEIPAGATVQVTKASGSGNDDWAHVTYNGISGYASMRYLKKIAHDHDYEAVVYEPTCEAAGYTRYTCTDCGHAYNDETLEPLGHAYGDWTNSSEPGQQIRTCSRCDSTQTQQVQTAVMGTITGSDLRIRAGAGTSYGVKGYLQKGDRVEILEQKTVDGMVWGHTEDGWISMSYVDLDEIVPEPPVEEPPVVEPPAQEPVMGTITGSNLRIRAGAGTSYGVKGYLQKRDRVEILEVKTVDGMAWGRIEQGWISMDYVELDQPEPESVIMTVNTNCLRVRGGTSFSAAIVDLLYEGTKVEVLETKTVDGTLWGRVADGWVCMEYLK